MKRIMLAFGTRPEAIKMCPLVNELKKRGVFEVITCVTGQHREMLDGVLSQFGVLPDIDLDIMKGGQTLSEITARILLGMERVLNETRPDALLVHGDTSTAFACALSAFYLGIEVYHVEAGLRTYDMSKPFPEEYNRRAISLVASKHFAPTEHTRENLIKEGVSEKNIYVTGNTVVDALKETVCAHFEHELLEWAEGKRLILLTAHRRESLGTRMSQMLKAVRRIADARDDVRVIYPVHKNPRVREVAYAVLGSHERIKLTEPVDTVVLHNILSRCYLALTDSGGIQEEASALRVPVLVMRDSTERPEGVSAGGIRLVGTEEERIAREVVRLLNDADLYESMKKAPNPYGDGHACERIGDILEKN